MSKLPARILVLGARGRLGAAVARQLRTAGGEVLTPDREQVNLADPEALATALRGLSFDALINCAALTSPDACAANPDMAWTVNATAPKVMAELCQTRGARLIHISTDYVFAGDGDAMPLTEEAATAPVSVYGETKRAAELAVLAACPVALVGRVSWLFGPDKPSFPDAILKDVRAGRTPSAIADKWSTPTSTEDLAMWLETILRAHVDLPGVLHLCNSGAATWQEYAQTAVDLAQELGLLPERVTVQGQPLAGFPLFVARRPRYTVMSNALLTARTGICPDPWEVSLRRYLEGVRQRELAANAN